MFVTIIKNRAYNIDIFVRVSGYGILCLIIYLILFVLLFIFSYPFLGCAIERGNLVYIRYFFDGRVGIGEGKRPLFTRSLSCVNCFGS